jgi:hypothetical protein
MRGDELDKLSGDALERWFTRTPGEIEQERRQAEAAGREAWGVATRNGQRAVARTQSELQALGRAVRDPAMRREAAMQVDTAVGAAADVLSLGTIDNIAAGLDALVGRGGPGDVRQRYQANVQKQRGRDAYDAEHRQVARAAGELAGSGLLYFGGARTGARTSSNLSPAAKGKLGESMSEAKTLWKGDRVASRGKPQELQGGGYTRTDHMTKSDQIVEAKFGPHASLSHRQRQAQREFGPRYRVDRWMPYHVGRVTGAGALGAGMIGQALDGDR